MSYVHQHPDFNLGNFINLTPAIFWHYWRMGKIPVYFATPYVRECFRDWQAIEILKEKPANAPLFASSLVNNANDRPDYQYAFEQATGTTWTPDFHTYVDIPQLSREEIEAWDGCIVVTNGAGNSSPAYVATKDPGEQAFREQITWARAMYKKSRVIATGSIDDLRRNPWLPAVCDECYFGNIRTSLKLLSLATYVIANDTGLAHAAGAMDKDMIVLMKNTPRERVKNAGTNTKYIYL